MARNDPKAGANVPREAMDAIEAAVFVRRTTMQALLAPVIERFATELRRDERIRDALAVRAKEDAQQGSVKQLEEAKRKRRS